MWGFWLCQGEILKVLFDLMHLCCHQKFTQVCVVVHCVNNILQKSWVPVSLEMVLHAKSRLHGVYSVLEAWEDVGEGVRHVGKEEGTEDEEIEKKESNETGVKANSDIR